MTGTCFVLVRETPTGKSEPLRAVRVYRDYDAACAAKNLAQWDRYDAGKFHILPAPIDDDPNPKGTA